MSYEALLLDLDGTLLDGRGEVRPRNLEALRALEARGVPVMIVTGRSSLSAAAILDRIGLETAAVLFNGAVVYCPRRRRLIEERVLSNRTLERALGYSRASGLLTVVMAAREKRGLEPRNEREREALKGLHGLRQVPLEELALDGAIRVTWFSDRHRGSGELAAEIEAFVDQPVYLTHFPLDVLVDHRGSEMDVVDLHPPCRGKAEALRVLEELYGVRPARVVAVGDATNDIPMLEAAGLGVCMSGGMPEASSVAGRVIGDHDSDAIAELVEELFGATPARR